jgi:Xaa-Pro aminopeptidase
MTQYKSKLDALRAAMNDVGVQAYLIPRADEFQGEFVAPYAERLKYISGFTGSAGLGIVTQDKAMILSDARYTIGDAVGWSAVFGRGLYSKTSL